MLPRSIRHTREAFDRTFRAAKRKHLAFGQVLFAPAPDLKISVVVGKKVDGTAVGRNRLRRRLYARFKALQQEGGRGHVIVILEPRIKTMPFAVAADELLQAARTFAVL